MGTETESNQKRLTLEDPVGAETLAKFGELENMRANVGMQLIDVRLEEVKLLSAARRIDDDRQKLFERILLDRGLPPNAPATIDAQTGKITLVQAPSGPAAAAPTPPETPSS